jgi:hypothetical protein
MTLGDLSAGQPYPYRSIQPAGSFSEGGQERLAQQEALPAGGHCPKPQFASLIPAVQYHAPPECRPLMPVPIEHPDELFA